MAKKALFAEKKNQSQILLTCTIIKGEICALIITSDSHPLRGQYFFNSAGGISLKERGSGNCAQHSDLIRDTFQVNRIWGWFFLSPKNFLYLYESIYLCFSSNISNLHKIIKKRVIKKSDWATILFYESDWTEVLCTIVVH